MDTTKPLVSIIIPCKKLENYTKECIEHCSKLDYKNYEIVLLPDYELGKLEEIKVIPTGEITPGAKRNIGVQNSNGSLCAFIDSDAFPRSDWLSNAIKYLNDPQVAAVGGPGLTPDKDDELQKASGYVLSSFMVGTISGRYKVKWSYESDDIHSCNFIVSKDVLKETGGWNERYWPGEDTLICLAIRGLGKRLIEASDVIVYHHRKPLFKEHLEQVSRFGLHRGFFAKRFRENSFKLTYFMPSLFILFLFLGLPVGLINSFFMDVLLVTVVIYLILCFIETLAEVKRARLVMLVWLGIIATHIVYGLSFLKGLIKSNLER